MSRRLTQVEESPPQTKQNKKQGNIFRDVEAGVLIPVKYGEISPCGKQPFVSWSGQLCSITVTPPPLVATTSRSSVGAASHAAAKAQPTKCISTASLEPSRGPRRVALVEEEREEAPGLPLVALVTRTAAAGGEPWRRRASGRRVRGLKSTRAPLPRTSATSRRRSAAATCAGGSAH